MRKKIATFDYLKGHDFTTNLRERTHCASFGEMADVFDVPKTTFSTWNTHNRTSHELVVRTHLRTGIPVYKLILPSDFSADELHHSFATEDPQASSDAIAETANEYNSKPHVAERSSTDIVILESYTLINGQLMSTGSIPYARRIFQNWRLDESAIIEVETQDARCLIDQNQCDAVSGEYLIDLNGHRSIHHIQRLPHALSVLFGSSTVEVSEDDLKVMGKVVVVLALG
ncbi:helix-turn-helix domain-containing protein [Photobacterium sp. 1_MG-2023]|uniref:helix-turn-helix domain-containing protein n=1 Tax=Photobacterium sp. 1_MG-2023 TaxID=3062646 RepID=UPI0026E3D76A|nr:helix-turn-helix domain-containing protein [Photobacterium sp. 1_MG-2023]MDO6706177.1 helix-turn-helix domain-containing protein [Photobacterium sp. 1_MG-2023]